MITTDTLIGLGILALLTLVVLTVYLAEIDRREGARWEDRDDADVTHEFKFMDPGGECDRDGNMG